MVMRETKRKIRSTLSLIFLSTVGILVAVLLFGAWRFLSPMILGGSDASGKLVRPLGAQVSLGDLRSRLSDKNINMESLDYASESGVIEGQIREGAKVYFSISSDPSWQVDSLYLIISRTTIDNKKPKTIDLRNTRPIVKF